VLKNIISIFVYIILPTTYLYFLNYGNFIITKTYHGPSFFYFNLYIISLGDGNTVIVKLLNNFCRFLTIIINYKYMFFLIYEVVGKFNYFHRFYYGLLYEIIIVINNIIFVLTVYNNMSQ